MSFVNTITSKLFNSVLAASRQQVKLVSVEKKINEIVNRLEKTKDERHPDLAAERATRDQEERNEKKAVLQETKKREKDEVKKKKEVEELRWACGDEWRAVVVVVVVVVVVS